MRFKTEFIKLLCALGLGLTSTIASAEVVQLRYQDSAPLQLSSIDRFIINQRFNNRLSYVMKTIEQRHPDYYRNVIEYLDELETKIKQPRQMQTQELSPFVCTPRSAISLGVETFNVEKSKLVLASRFSEDRSENLPDSILPCVAEIDGNRYVTTNGGSDTGYARGLADDAIRTFGNGDGRFYPISSAYQGGLAQYLVALLTNSDTIDIKEWTRYRIADFILFQLDAGFIWPRLPTAQPEFDFNVTKVYFETRFRPVFSFAPSQSEASVLFEKTFFEPNLIKYDQRYNVAIDFPVISVEEIVGIIARFGKGVAFDRSGFEPFIGTFTYPWQILFHTDINPRFSRIYRDLFRTAAFNDNWLIWANFIAGNGDEDTLRNSTFFRNQFKNIIVKDAVP